MKYIDQDDGTLLKAWSPLEDLPFYSAWLEALLLRCAAFETSKKNPRTGKWEPCIMTYDRWQEQAVHVYDDGSVGVICIGCATPTASMDMSKIKVGGLVQFALEEPTDERHNGRVVSAIRKWRQKSVSKSGLGCPACVQLYMLEDARVVADNEQRRLYARALKQVYLKKGDFEAASKMAPPKEFQAWIDILGSEVKLYQLSAAQERML